MEYLFQTTDQVEALLEKSGKSYLRLIQIIDHMVGKENPETLITNFKSDAELYQEAMAKLVEEYGV